MLPAYSVSTNCMTSLDLSYKRQDPFAKTRTSPCLSRTETRPTFVLVHGAFADASSWQGVVERLQKYGYAVMAVANPLRGLTSDSAYIASILRTIGGPIVLVGHSYGGAVITNAAAGNSNVRALVYVAAYSLDVGESADELTNRFPGSRVSSASVQVPFNTAHTSGTDLYIQPALYRQVFTGDISPTWASALAASQRPAATTAFSERSQAAAWKNIRSWAVIPEDDQLIPPAAQRFMTARAQSCTTTVPGGAHAVMLLHHDVVARVLMDAAHSACSPVRPFQAI